MGKISRYTYIYKEESYVLFWKSETNKWNKQLDSIRENVKYRRWTRVQERQALSGNDTQPIGNYIEVLSD